jgi:flagellar biosynthesis/type III secretory pathway chaperone
MTSHDRSSERMTPAPGGGPPRLYAELLDQAEANLEQLLQTAKAMREALLKADQEGLRQAHTQQESLLQGMLAIREKLAALEGSQRHSHPGGVELERSKERVRALAEEVDALNRRNATLMRSCLGFVQYCLYDVAGGGAAVTRYGPTGAKVEVRRGTFLEARG